MSSSTNKLQKEIIIEASNSRESLTSKTSKKEGVTDLESSAVDIKIDLNAERGVTDSSALQTNSESNLSRAGDSGDDNLSENEDRPEESATAMPLSTSHPIQEADEEVENE